MRWGEDEEIEDATITPEHECYQQLLVSQSGMSLLLSIVHCVLLTISCQDQIVASVIPHGQKALQAS